MKIILNSNSKQICISWNNIEVWLIYINILKEFVQSKSDWSSLSILNLCWGQFQWIFCNVYKCYAIPWFTIHRKSKVITVTCEDCSKWQDPINPREIVRRKNTTNVHIAHVSNISYFHWILFHGHSVVYCNTALHIYHNHNMIVEVNYRVQPWIVWYQLKHLVGTLFIETLFLLVDLHSIWFHSIINVIWLQQWPMLIWKILIEVWNQPCVHGVWTQFKQCHWTIECVTHDWNIWWCGIMTVIEVEFQVRLYNVSFSAFSKLMGVNSHYCRKHDQCKDFKCIHQQVLIQQGGELEWEPTVRKQNME